MLCSPELFRRKVLWEDFLSCIDLALMLPLRESQYPGPSNEEYAAVIIQQWARLLCLTKGKWKERSGLFKDMKVQYSCLRPNSERGECETCLDTPLKDFQAQLALLSLWAGVHVIWTPPTYRIPKACAHWYSSSHLPRTFTFQQCLPAEARLDRLNIIILCFLNRCLKPIWSRDWPHC